MLPERDWILRAPTLQRKLALTAKIQDEVGHAQLIYRVVEDLGKPRSACLDDLVSGKAKFHNVFHYPTRTWGDVGVIAWLVDAAAIVSQKALLKCSYAPYARIMKKICWEESFHILHGRDVILALVTGTDEQFGLVQEALDRWWEPLMHFHGNPIPAEEDPMFDLADQEPGQRGGASAVPRGLRAADPRARARRSPTRRCARTRRPARGSTPSPTGRSCAPSSPATARRLRSGSRSGGSRARTWPGSSGWCSRRPREPRLRGLPPGAEGAAVPARGSVIAPDERFAEIYAREQYGAAPGVGRAVARPARRTARDRRVPRRVRDEVPPRRRLLDQGTAAEARERAGTLDMAPGASERE